MNVNFKLKLHLKEKIEEHIKKVKRNQKEKEELSLINQSQKTLLVKLKYKFRTYIRKLCIFKNG